MKRVKATREGCIGAYTKTGHRVVGYTETQKCIAGRTASNFFVALPDESAIFRVVRIINPLNGLTATVPVLDVGPWNTDDSAYVFGIARPQAESGKDRRGRKTNGAGIDLSEGVWVLLGMQDNTEVEWEFV